MPTKAENLWKRYVIAVALVAIAVTMSHVIATQRSGASSVIAADVNISGRQRMLSQRITLFARSFAGSTDPVQKADYLETLGSDLALFTDSHDQLRNRDYLTPSHLGIYKGAFDQIGLDQMVSEFQNLIARITAGGNINPDADLALLQELATGPLLRQLNASVGAFEAAVTSVEARQVRLANLTFYLAIALLVFEAVFIFWPAHRAIITTLAGLKKERHLAEAARDAASQASKDRQDALDEKTQFFNRLSLDLRTPLNGVVAGADLLSEAELTEDDKETVEVIISSGQELEQKIDALLLATKPDDQIANAQLSYFDLHQFIEDLKDVSKTGAAADVRLVIENEIPKNYPVEADMDQFKHVAELVLGGVLSLRDQGELRLAATKHGFGHEHSMTLVISDVEPEFESIWISDQRPDQEIR
ncbi:MAG: histidine kinase dimerization/phospho-acceptor domain-containing protein, partial [Pseudomonadota bacterium]